MVAMVSSIANGGTYVKPRVVKATINSVTKERKEIEVIKKDRVISEETYRIGGKTGTSEDGVNTGKYVTSFIGVAPISNPTVAVLITLYNPTGEGGHQGGGVAAPIGAQVFGEVLPYLETIKDGETGEEAKQEIEVPNIEGKTIKEATSILKENNLQIVISNEQEGMDKENTTVKQQTPKATIRVKEGSNIYVEW